MNLFNGNLVIIGRGSDPTVNNYYSIGLDKDVLAGLDRNRPLGGYPASQERAIAEMRARVREYEDAYGEVI